MKQEIQTSDIYRGAHLLCHGGKLRDSFLLDGKHVVFVIHGNDVSEEDERFRAGKALVNPLALRDSLNLLRDIVFEQLKKKQEIRRQHEQKSRRGASKTASQHRIGNRKERNAIKEGRQELQGVMSLSQ